MNKYEDYINEVERLFEENRAKEAEKLLLDAAETAKSEGNRAFELQMLNELIGYYRQTSEKEQLISVMNRALKTAENMGLAESESGKIPYATTVLNVATGYRSIGELERAEIYYEQVQKIYSDTLEKNDMLLAGLYNNMSLLNQEKGDFQKAMEDLLRALDIAEYNQAGFEIAVTYANLANTAILAAQYEKAKEYALEAIERFESRNTIDAHYCAALSALGMYFYWKESYQRAGAVFQKAMDIIEKGLGQNAQYHRLKENRDMCLDKCMSGLKLSELYYETYGKEMIAKHFSMYQSRIVTGLVGEGSDCFGYDDTLSTDHDWGPDFCIWIPDELYEEIGEALSEAYSQLPQEFMGYHRTTTDRGKNRRGVMKISDFYSHFLDTAEYASIDWRTVPDYALAAVTNGKIFADESGEFSRLREELLKGYPEGIRYLKLAEDLARISQTGQYNFARMLNRGDRITADMLLSDCIRQIMILVHHVENRYPPHDKWLHKSFEKIAGGTELAGLLDQLHASFRMSDAEALSKVQETMERVGEHIAKELYSRDCISDIEPYLDFHTEELLKKASYADMTDEELVERIARTEFAAFDKVKNEGGRASCQDNWPVFSVMRKSQYLSWTRTMLMQYLYDFSTEYELGHNLITEKYGRMMESTAPDEYDKIKEMIPELSDQKKAVVEQIVAVQINMLEEFGKRYPKAAENVRSFHSYQDSFLNTSYETYLRGEISTYSDKMLQLYGKYVIECAQNGMNIATMTIQNTAKLYGYSDIDSFENSI